jgi:DNA-binding response OmpR family regulator
MTATAPKKSVLVVDDDDAIRQLLVKALSPKYTVHEASGAIAASELLSKIAPPDLLICDVMMPGFDGFSFVKSLKSAVSLRSMQVIFLTAKSGPQSVITGIQLGAKHYIQKPFSVKDLVDKITKLLG